MEGNNVDNLDEKHASVLVTIEETRMRTKLKIRDEKFKQLCTHTGADCAIMLL